MERREYGMSGAIEADCVVTALGHDVFGKLRVDKLKRMYKPYKQKIIADVSGVFDRDTLTEVGFMYWSL